jgi:hypothetical protein
MTRAEMHEIGRRIGQLTVVEQLAFIEQLIRGLRRAFTDDDAMAKDISEMAADPDIQRVLRGEDVVNPPKGR